MSRRSDASMLRKAIKSSIQQTYPLALSDITKEHMRMLIEVLNIDNIIPLDRRTSIPQNPAWIEEGIRRLPWELRRHKFIRVVPNAFLYPAVLCESHDGLNPYLIGHILSLIRREVVEHLRHLERYTGEMDSGCRELLTELTGIRGLWSSDRKYKWYLELMSFTHQHNRCEACMLAQIVGSPPCLQNLRTTLLSRTRTRAKPGRPHRAPQLLRFIDGAIDKHENLITDLFYQSGQLAYSFKAVRKLATDHYKDRAKGKNHEEDKSDDECNPDLNHKKRETIHVFWDKEAEQSSDLSGPTAVETFSGMTAARSTNPKTAADHDEEFERIYENREPTRTTPSEALIEEIIAEYAGLTGTENIEDAKLSLLNLQPDLVPPTPLSVTKPAMESPRVSYRDPYAASPKAAHYPTERGRSPLAFRGKSSVPGSPTMKYYPTDPSPLASQGRRPSADSPTTKHFPTERRRPSLMSSGSPRKSQFDYSAPRDNVNWRKVVHKSSPLSMLSAKAESACHGLENDAEQIAFEYRGLMTPVAYSESEYSVSPAPSRNQSPAPSPRRLTTWDVLCSNLDIEYPVPQLQETRKKGFLRRLLK